MSSRRRGFCSRRVHLQQRTSEAVVVVGQRDYGGALIRSDRVRIVRDFYKGNGTRQNHGCKKTMGDVDNGRGSLTKWRVGDGTSKCLPNTADAAMPDGRLKWSWSVDLEDRGPRDGTHTRWTSESQRSFRDGKIGSGS